MKTLESNSGLWTAWVPSVVSGVILGLIMRLLFSAKPFIHRAEQPILIMTVAFLFFVPLATGYLVVSRYLRFAPPENVRWYRWIFLPWISVLIIFGISYFFKLEGIICLIFASPIMFFASLLGGLFARSLWTRLGKRAPGSLCAMAFPLLLLFTESYFPVPTKFRTVRTEILIHAPANTVWNNIKSVPPIAPSELPDSWVREIGFPRPIAATLNHEGVGGIRQATFTGGLIFTETVSDWSPEERLRFSIRANTESIPTSTLDAHVTIGGAYFEVLTGEYTLEQRPGGILLHLQSRQRMSTHFNPYAGLFTDSVMRAIQNQILEVVRKRCERDALTDEK